MSPEQRTQELFSLIVRRSLSVEKIQALINAGVDINAKDTGGNTPLHTAVRWNYPEVVELLLVHGARVDIKNDQGKTALDLVNGRNVSPDIRKLVQDRQESTERTEKSFKLIKLSYPDLSKIENLISAGVIIDAQDKDKQYTLLHWATYNRHYEIVQLLLKQLEININAQDRYGNTPLHLAAKKDYSEIVQLLLRQETINVNAQNRYGNTPLHSAVMANSYESANFLLNHPGIKIETKDNGGNTPLHRAVFEDNIEFTELLLNHSADVNATDNNGNTPLFLTIYYNHINSSKIAKLLIEHDADVNIKNRHGNTVFNTRNDITEILPSVKGRKINSKGKTWQRSYYSI
jgi:ankyrin repeat protein